MSQNGHLLGLVRHLRLMVVPKPMNVVRFTNLHSLPNIIDLMNLIQKNIIFYYLIHCNHPFFLLHTSPTFLNHHNPLLIRITLNRLRRIFLPYIVGRLPLPQYRVHYLTNLQTFLN